MPDQNDPKDRIDLSKILLPKKGPSVDSAQRINAGALFEQEKNASLPVPEKKEEPQPVAKPQKDLVQPLQTYQGDIESVVGEKNISVVSIAAAEADRRGMAKLQSDQAPLNQSGRPWLTKTLMIGGGLVLLLAAVGIGYYIYSRTVPVPIAVQSPAPFISVDDTQTVQIDPTDARATIMQALVNAQKNVALSLGLIERIQVVEQASSSAGALQEVSAPDFLQILAPSIPQDLLRTLQPQMLLGVHSYDQNQAFMILKTDSYETAYSAMLAWEATMQQDLSPLFTRTPEVHATSGAALPVPAGTSTQTATTTATASSTAPAAATSTAPATFFQGNFLDQIVENRDTRVILNQSGDILLLWTFLDRNTILITTNEATLREVVSRVSQASVISLPNGQ